MANGLMLHTGAHAASLDDAKAVVTPEPTETWFPIPHLTVRDLVVERLQAGGLRIVEEALGLWKDGARAFGLLGVENGQSSQSYRMVVGWRNSHDQSFPAAGAIGSHVFVCDNLAFSGEVTFARKHTRFVLRDLPGIVERAIARLTNLRGAQDRRIALYQETEISTMQAHDLMIQAVDARALAVTRLPDVLGEWRKPRHPEFVPRTMWSLFNAFTEVEKGQSLLNIPRHTMALQGVFDRNVGFDRMLAAGPQHEGDAVAAPDYEIVEEK